MPLMRPVIYKGMVLITRQAFRFSGREFKPGDRFDYTKLAVDWRKVCQLYDHGRIRPEFQEDEAPKKLPKVKAEEVTEPSVPEDSSESEVPKTKEKATPTQKRMRKRKE